MSGIVPTTNIARANITLEIGVGFAGSQFKKTCIIIHKKGGYSYVA